MNKQDLLFELGTEELPPKSLLKLSNALKLQMAENLKASELEFDDLVAFATPRRLAVLVKNLVSGQADKNVQKLGPAVDAAFNDDGSAKPAAIGFAKSCGVDVSELEKIETDKGLRLGYNLAQKGQAVSELIEDIINNALKKLPIPKAMRWGDRNEQFIRPVHWAVLLHGDQILKANVVGVESSNITYGHRFMAPDAIRLESASEYQSQLLSAKVQVDYGARKQQIQQQVLAEAEKINGIAQISDDLLNEVTGLVEWPSALTGNFDKEFLAAPKECLVSSMAEHQKYFHVTDENGALLPSFITVANIESSNPQSVISGNEKVIRPRLADAMFFFETDKKSNLASHQESLKNVIFQKDLGSVQDKAERVAKLAKEIAITIGADPEQAERAGLLSKCDLVTNMVGEFDKLQGVMGTYYARHDGEPDNVATAMTEQYLPKFSGDKLAQNPVGQTLAIADRIDTLVGIFGIGQIPKGSKDPFALRRSAIGLIRTIVENKLDLDLVSLIDSATNNFNGSLKNTNVKSELLDFILDRFRAWYQEQGIDANTILSVLALRPTNPLDFDSRVKAVQYFQTLPEAESLSAANKRVKNILAKSEVDVSAVINTELLSEDSELSLSQAISETEIQLEKEDSYQNQLACLATLRDPVDVFFENVMVNAEDPKLKINRLAILKKLEILFGSVADISLLQS